MPGYVDIHSHILPGIDDGPSTLESSLNLLRVAFEAGTTRMVTTPHLFHDSFPHVTPDGIARLFEQLQADLKQRSEEEEWSFLGKMEVLLGAEHFLSPDLRRALKDNSVVPLNGSRYILVEGPTTLSMLNWKESLSRVAAAGYWPVMAHPERYWAFQRDPSHLAELVGEGCLVQLNATDMTSGGATSRAAGKFLKLGIVHLIASDSHHAAHRPPELPAAAAALPGGATGSAARLLLESNPSAIVDNADPPPPLSAGAAGLWARLRSRLS